MRPFIVICFLSLLGVVLARPKELYSDKYDNIDLDEILSNRRLLIPYVKCTLDEGKCSADGKDMRAHIKESMETECAKCTPKQKRHSRKVLKHMVTKEKEFWEQIKAKYDPEGKYAPKYEEAVAKGEVEKLFTSSD